MTTRASSPPCAPCPAWHLPGSGSNGDAHGPQHWGTLEGPQSEGDYPTSCPDNAFINCQEGDGRCPPVRRTSHPTISADFLARRGGEGHPVTRRGHIPTRSLVAWCWRRGCAEGAGPCAGEPSLPCRHRAWPGPAVPFLGGAGWGEDTPTGAGWESDTTDRAASTWDVGKRLPRASGTCVARMSIRTRSAKPVGGRELLIHEKSSKARGWFSWERRRLQWLCIY